ncbi:ATP phosphoribosyltransferase regulatory subunit [Radiobacillus kanasensis]|uniref:ATP phosphoribosyltransferase regulatory subunit n=1 Tax=Radiobacillus kanasensis TaxID=2844358 RepID=UPI001E63F0E0|nr:ATP phosphoribosyltransferase regulatory subunit [Radiobacillus kanasensis]UFU01160.1 ATP phosphoribosyltransferase regulatory subunit [Radiobacillus kanasensis]
MFLPAGSQDEMGSIINNRAKAFEAFRIITSRRNFKQISTPVVEFAHTFTNPYVGMNLQSMLKWFNKDGEIEVLRPDWTTAIARALVHQAKSQKKWSYQGSVFRSDKAGTESRQAGIEILHTESFLGEGESLLTAMSYLDELSITEYLIELGHTGIFEELTLPLKLTVEAEKKLRQAMHDKRKDEVHVLATKSGSEDIAEELVDLIDAYGSADLIEKYEEKWSNRERLLSILNHLKSLVSLMKASGMQDVTVDLGRVKNLPYYDGTMFRGYMKDTGEICFSGGRYDKLYEQFQETVSAVGLAFDVDVLAENISLERERQRIAILASKASHVFAESVRASYPNDVVDIVYELPQDHKFEIVLQIEEENSTFKVVKQ